MRQLQILGSNKQRHNLESKNTHIKVGCLNRGDRAEKVAMLKQDGGNVLNEPPDPSDYLDTSLK